MVYLKKHEKARPVHEILVLIAYDLWAAKSPDNSAYTLSLTRAFNVIWRLRPNVRPLAPLYCCTYMILHSGSVVEYLTWDGDDAGLSLTGVTALCPWSRHIGPCLVLIQPRKAHPNIAEKLLTGMLRIKSNKKTLKYATNKICLI